MKRKALDFSSDDNLDSEDEWKPNNNHKSSDSEENYNYLSENIMTKESENIVEREFEGIEIEKEQEIEIETEEDNNLVRWRRGQPEKWKRNVALKKRKLSKKPLAIDCSKCKFKCSISFDENYRVQLCREYWSLDYAQQKNFILSRVSQYSVKRHVPITGSRIAKQTSKNYKFLNNNTPIRVCKPFFLKTLSISHGPVDKAFENYNEKTGIHIHTDNRGKKEPVNKKSSETINSIKNHIEKFPIVESHYCRSNTKRQYLDPTLSISKMHELYIQESIEKGNEPVSLTTYRTIFSENYNLDFFKPKKDQCLSCEKFKNAEKPIQEDIANNYENHIRRRDESFAAKNLDKERAVLNDNFCSATFDLQSVLQIPSSEVSSMYYSRKLCTYNLTLYEAASPNKAFCYLWTELEGQRGSSEIGSALLKWINQLPQNLNEISLYSDTCSGQNRNQYIAALFLFVVNNSQNINILTHNFMESGHSYMEVDTRSNRRKKSSSPYSVQELKYTDFMDLRSLAGTIMKNRSVDENGEKVNWLKIKVMRYEKSNPSAIKFKYNYSDEEFKIIRVGGRGRPPKCPQTLKQLYTKQIPISDAKKNDLLKLCNTEAVPKEFHEWYKNIPSCTKNKDANIIITEFEDQSE
ncbi:Uncharacterized protein FWK35_00022965 [Aphis craccivora]|uniref:Uncharacterized protein n=1 Tax=Aphis craccivora TaxID=307492 RepID=A0A6G0Y6D5_APHCR|nr:Uncharacterized protein FWK35_00022965 [Aphis craccivora]